MNFTSLYYVEQGVYFILKYFNPEVINETEPIFLNLQTDKPKKDDDATPSTSKEEETVYIPKCQYWDECYRKDPNHLKQYLHPGDGRKSTRPKPAKKLEEGVQVSLPGGYRLKRTGSDFTCT